MILPNGGELSSPVLTRWIPLTLGLLSFIGAVGIIFIQVRFIRMRFYSGKLILHIAIIQLLNSILFAMSLFYVSISQEDLNSNSIPNFAFTVNFFFGNLLSFIEVHISMAYSFYHFCMAHNLYISSKRTSTSINMQKRHFYYVLISQVTALTISIIVTATDGLGYQLIGVFGLGMSSNWQYINMLILIINLPFSVAAILYSRHLNRRLDQEAIVEEDYEREIRHDFVNTNCLYLLMYLITWIPYTLISWISTYANSDCACTNLNSSRVILMIVTFYLLISSAFMSLIVGITRSIVWKKLKERFQKRKRSEGLIRILLDESIIEPDDENSHGHAINDAESMILMENRTKRISIDESEIFKKSPYSHDPLKNKNVPLKKPIPPAEHLDILLAIINSVDKLENTPREFPDTPWSQHEYSDCINETIDTASIFTREQQNLLRDKLKKEITFRSVNIISYASNVFKHLHTIWKITPKILQETFYFNSNIEFFANIHRKPFSHLEKRYFHVTPDKKILLQVCDKEAKIYFVDKFLPAYHTFMATNISSFIIKILGLYTFNITKSTHNVISVLNCYEKFYDNCNNNREGNNIGIPSLIIERYLIDAKKFRHELYEEGILRKKNKKNTSEKEAKRIFSLPAPAKTEIMTQLKKDLKFLNAHNIINYRVVLLRTNDSRRKNSLMERPQLESRGKYLIDGSVTLNDGSALKIFIDTNLQTSKMKPCSQKTPMMFSVENSDVYRQCIEEVINSLL